MHWANLNGKQLALKRALLQAYHGDGKAPSDHDVLVEAAQSVGLDAAEARKRDEELRRAQDADFKRKTEDEARRRLALHPALQSEAPHPINVRKERES